MANTILEILEQKLDKCVSDLDSIRALYSSRPGTDFTRERKYTVPVICKAMLQMQGKSLSNEVLDFWGNSKDAPTPSAFIQQRGKLDKDAFGFLFRDFNDETLAFQGALFKGYRVLACDGSDANICRDPSDEETFIQEGEKGYNAIHINALYDLMNHTYQDVVFQGKKKNHEREAFNHMVDHSCLGKAIYVADRGYESFNTFAHVIRSGQKFIIRVKDTDSNGILSSYDLPEGEFDETVETILTKRRTKETVEHPETYTVLSGSTAFDFLDEGRKFYPIAFRIVRFLTPSGSYVCVATNLPPDEFSLEDIRALYGMRWGQETSFRELKYTIGLVSFHSRKKELVLQEIYCRLILYNFCEMVTQHAVPKTKGHTKHCYRIDFSTAVNICRAYLRDGSDPVGRMEAIQKHLTPIRGGRNFERKLRPKRCASFMYRAA